MGLGRKNKHVAEVNLSSMTDIIFMLLIFFMLTSTLVKMTDFELPESQSRAKAPIKINLEIKANGEMEVNDVPTTMAQLEEAIKQVIAQKAVPNEAVTLTIFSEKTTAFKYIGEIMKIANRVHCKLIIATQPKT